MSVPSLIGETIEKVLTHYPDLDLGSLPDLESLVAVPKDKSHGDFAFPCFQLAKLLRKSPVAIAQELEPLLQTAVQGSRLSNVKAMGPYLNFHINKAALAAELIPAILDGPFIAKREPNQRKVMIEYSQPNTHKAFHVGHTRNLALGNALVRTFDWFGYEVVAANYIGDEGAHIAKCLWYYENHFDGDMPDTNLGEFLGDLYTRATIMLDFKTLTRVPMPKVVTAKVVAVDDFPENPKNKIVKVDQGNNQVQVICGGTDYKPGDIVAYAGVGSRVAGKPVGGIEKSGVTSTGMICSGKELGLNDDHMRIYTFPEGTGLGLELAEYFRIEDALPDDVSVLEEMAGRTKGVADTLKRLEAKEPAITELWARTKKWSMDEFYKIYDWFDARFDHYFFESEVGDTGKNMVLDYYKKGVLVQSQGAIGADLEADKLPFFLLLKSDGTGLYSTKDIALAHEKFDNFNIDTSIYVVDASQSLHFQQVFKTLEKMGYAQAKNCFHLAYGLVVLPDGKMSSRDGNIILFSELRERLDQRIRANFLDNFKGEWPDEEIAEASKRISSATIKYGMLNMDNMKVIVFDLEEWTSKSGNTGPYLLYAYARTRSILRKAGDLNTETIDWSLMAHEAEQRLLAHMAKFHETVAKSCEEYRPQILCNYLYQLAKDFSKMYDNCPVLTAETDALKTTRIQLVDAAGQLLKQGLALLGIETLERM